MVRSRERVIAEGVKINGTLHSMSFATTATVPAAFPADSPAGLRPVHFERGSCDKILMYSIN